MSQRPPDRVPTCSTHFPALGRVDTVLLIVFMQRFTLFQMKEQSQVSTDWRKRITLMTVRI